MIKTDYACIPVCKACREAESCPKAHSPENLLADYQEGAPRREWQPNMERDVLLKCGCWLPWPVVSLLGSNGNQVMCGEHGWQKVTGKDISAATRYLREELLAISRPSTPLPDEPPY